MLALSCRWSCLYVSWSICEGPGWVFRVSSAFEYALLGLSCRDVLWLWVRGSHFSSGWLHFRKTSWELAFRHPEDLKGFSPGVLFWSSIYPQAVHSVSLEKCVCVCVCLGLGSMCPAPSGWKKAEGCGKWLLRSSCQLLRLPVTQSIWGPPHAWSLSDFCRTEGSPCPRRTFCLHSFKRLSSSFHFPEICNSLFQ